MGALMRATDWSQTVFGPVADWPQSLRTAISIMLESRFAMVVAWGPEFRFFYNDRYRPILGDQASGGARRARRRDLSRSLAGRSARSSSASAAARPSRSTTGCSRSIATATWRTAGSRCRTARSATKPAAWAACSRWWRRRPAASRASGGWRRCASWRVARPTRRRPNRRASTPAHVFDANPDRRAVRADLPARPRRRELRRRVCGVGIRADHPASIETGGARLGVRRPSGRWRDVVASGKTHGRSTDLRAAFRPAARRARTTEPTHTAILLPLVAARSRASVRRAGRRRQSRAARWTIGTATSSSWPPITSRPPSATPSRSRRRGAAPRRWPRSIAPRPRSSATSATSSARR